jgi:hypothetical protein
VREPAAEDGRATGRADALVGLLARGFPLTLPPDDDLLMGQPN